MFTFTHQGRDYQFPVEPEQELIADYSVVTRASTQNGLRADIRTLFVYAGHFRISDLRITHGRQGYTLYAYTRNWSGYACYLAGMIEVRRQQRRRRETAV